MKKFNYLLALLGIILTLLTFHNLFPQINQSWVARYNGPGNYLDEAVAIATDSEGNAYVTGKSDGIGSSTDYATIKYNSEGVQQWVARYSRGNAVSIAVDGSDNVYVTGYSHGSQSDIDYVTIKYNSDGDQEWVAKYYGPGNSSDFASSIVVDGTGNVYVTGYSYGSGTGDDYATIKYNSSGDSVWVKRYNGPGNSHDRASSIAVDGSGNVYVTGSSADTGVFGNNDFATIKYNSDGDSLWVARYNGPGNGDDLPRSMTLDNSGNVYVTGYSNGSGTGDDFCTIKYNTAGVQQWVARFSGTGYSGEYARSITLDGSGNIYVTGYGNVSGSYWDYATVKYNSAGVQQWVKRYNGSGNDIDRAYSIAVDNSGNVFVTGESTISGNIVDCATIKYNSDGEEQWVSSYNGLENNHNIATSIALDNSGNVYITGISYDGIGTSLDYITIKNPQLITDIRQISSEIPGQYSLSQNYPNPFNPTTNLEFGISELGLVTLKIYDIMGREIQTLVNERLAPGSYNYQFSTVNYQLPSGVYFYRLTATGGAGEFTETKWMMLVK